MKKRGLIILTAAALIAVLMLQAGPVRAADRYWTWSGIDWWNDNGDWNTKIDYTGSTGQPLSGDNAYIFGSGSGSTTIYYYTDYAPLNLSSLTLDGAGSGTVTLWQGYLGYNHSLSANTELIGDSGSGTFIQSGGSNTIAYELYVGNQAGSSGIYQLTGTGALSVGTVEFIGINGSGSFRQLGGTNVASQVVLGVASGSSGTYQINEGGSLVADYETIGAAGAGSFKQAAGTNTVTDTLLIASQPGSSGTYELSAGTVNAGSIINNDTFNQSGGKLYGPLTNNSLFTYSGGEFHGQLINNGTVNFNADFTAGDGMVHYTDLTIPSGRTIKLNGQGLDNEGSITITGGTIGGNGPLVNNGYMAGYGTITGLGGFTNNSLLVQSGGALTLSNSGTNVNNGNIDLEAGRQLRLVNSTLTNSGSINLNGAIVTGTGQLVNSTGGVISGRGTISSDFSNDGGLLLIENGTTNITKSFGNTGLIQLAGLTANLTGADFGNNGKIEGYGNVGNTILNLGTIEARGGTLTLSGSVSNLTAGRIGAGSGSEIVMTRGLSNQGLIYLTGGTFDDNKKGITNYGRISGYGVLNTSLLDNNGFVTLSGSNGSTTMVNGNVKNEVTGTLTVAQNPAIFTGNTTNYGTFKATNTTVTFAGSYTEYGTYKSDPALNVITGDAVINATGNWVGGAGDEWRISGNFMNHSTQNTAWNTNLSTITLTGTGNHLFYLAGADKGAHLSGYSDNFAWGTLSIQDGGSLTLNADEATGFAQYVGSILGLSIDGSGHVTNISEVAGSTLNIYYLASAQDNGYLGDLTYSLTGGGQLIPVNGSPVPIPPGAWLLGAGLAGIGAARRKLKK